MQTSALHARDVEALSWRDIEVLPYYIIAAVIIVAFFEGLADAGHALRTDAAKAMLLVALVGVRWAFLREGGTWPDEPRGPEADRGNTANA